MDTIDKTDHRLAMMGQMLRATGTDLADISSLSKLGRYNTMVSHCLECHSPEACETWLKEGHQQAKAPGFCPNAKLINDKHSHK